MAVDWDPVTVYNFTVGELAFLFIYLFIFRHMLHGPFTGVCGHPEEWVSHLANYPPKLGTIGWKDTESCDIDTYTIYNIRYR